MKERIQEFLKAENKSSAQLAEEIGVQPSGISHIISGRNNPSLDFVLKMFDRYKYLSTDWLLFGKGSMYKDKQLLNLFSKESELELKDENSNHKSGTDDYANDIQDIKSSKRKLDIENRPLSEHPEVVKIVWFYNDNSFDEYFPKR